MERIKLLSYMAAGDAVGPARLTRLVLLAVLLLLVLFLAVLLLGIHNIS